MSTSKYLCMESETWITKYVREWLTTRYEYFLFVYISQLIRYARACSTYDQFLVRGNLLTNKLMSRVSTVSFTGSFPQILWSLQRSYLLIQPFFGPRAVWYVSYQSLSRSLHTDIDYGSYRLSNLEIRLTAGVTGQQGIMFTPPWHLIPPLVYSEVRVRLNSGLHFLWDLWDWLLFVIINW